MKPIDLRIGEQEELYRQACRRMRQLSPDWDETIASDPAVAILELTCWLSEQQGRRLNELGEAHYRAFLRLLGAEAAKLAPASLLAASCGERRPASGQRFWINSVPYEVTDAGEERGRLLQVYVRQGGRSRIWDEEAPLELDGGDTELYLELSGPLPPGRPVRLWCAVCPEEGRVPPEEDTPPPAALRAHIRAEGIWREVPAKDGTCGLLRSGFWSFTPVRECRRVRLTLEGQLEGRPRVAGFALEPVRLEQRCTRSAVIDLLPPFRLPEEWLGSRTLRCFLPEGEGWREAPELFVRGGVVRGWAGAHPGVLRIVAAEPDFPCEFPLRPLAGEEIPMEKGTLPESVRLMVEEGGLWYDCDVREPDPERTLRRGCMWDRRNNLLRFGDGRDFCPPQGGRLLVCACAVTLGSGGNGASGSFGEDGVCLRALCPAGGGRDTESARAAFFRAAEEQKYPLRAVTCQDYERLARDAPGLALRQIRAIAGRSRGWGEAGVTVLARPCSRQPHPALTLWQAARLRERLEQYRLIGVPVFVRSPRYLPVEVQVSLRTDVPLEESAVRQAVERVVDGVSGPVDFGGELSYSALFSALAGLKNVRAVTALELRPLAGGVTRTQEGGVRLAADMLPYLERLQVTWV